MTRISYTTNRVLDSDGIADGATISVYQSGTEIPISLYEDPLYTVPVANPFSVGAGAAVPTRYYNYAGDVRVRVVTADGEVVSDEDPYSTFLYTGDVDSLISDLETDIATVEADVADLESTKADADGDTLTNTTLTEPTINGPVTGTFVVDEDDMVSNSEVKVPTQQSTKAYSDSKITGTMAAKGHLDFVLSNGQIYRRVWGNKTVTASTTTTDTFESGVTITTLYGVGVGGGGNNAESFNVLAYPNGTSNVNSVYLYNADNDSQVIYWEAWGLYTP